MSDEPRQIHPGERAPEFTLPAVHRDGTVSLKDYRGKNAVLLAFFRGIYCPFCRRQIAKLGLVRDRLLAAGLETLAVLASDVARARLYYGYRPTRVPLATDPHLTTHRAFGIRKLPVDEALMHAVQTVRTDAMGELPTPMPVGEVFSVLQQKDGFQPTEVDTRESQEQLLTDTGQFLVDRDGIVQWVNLELAGSGLAGIGKFPSDEELLALAKRHG